MSIIAIIMIVSGAFLIYKARAFKHRVQKAEFERRNSAGVQEFQSYEAMQKTTRKETGSRFVGAIFFVGGCSSFAIGALLLIAVMTTKS